MVESCHHFAPSTERPGALPSEKAEAPLLVIRLKANRSRVCRGFWLLEGSAAILSLKTQRIQSCDARLGQTIRGGSALNLLATGQVAAVANPPTTLPAIPDNCVPADLAESSQNAALDGDVPCVVDGDQFIPKASGQLGGGLILIEDTFFVHSPKHPLRSGQHW